MRSDPSLMLPSTTASGSESRQSSTHSHSCIHTAIPTSRPYRRLTPARKEADDVCSFFFNLCQKIQAQRGNDDG